MDDNGKGDIISEISGQIYNDINQNLSGAGNSQININSNAGPININHSSENIAHYKQVEIKSTSWKKFIGAYLTKALASFLLSRLTMYWSHLLQPNSHVALFSTSTQAAQNNLNHVLFSLMLLVISVGFLVGAVVLLLYGVLNSIFLLQKKIIWVRNKLYYSKDRVLFSSQFVGNCPISSCTGTLLVKKPLENEEHVTIVGVCNKAPSTHTFHFNIDSMQGDRVKLTPKKRSTQ